MKIGLIDVDGHRYPNLALMKLSVTSITYSMPHPSFRELWMRF